MAALGGTNHQQLYQEVLARAQVIWQHAQNPIATAAVNAGPDQEMTIGGGQVLFATPDISDRQPATEDTLRRGQPSTPPP